MSRFCETTCAGLLLGVMLSTVPAVSQAQESATTTDDDEQQKELTRPVTQAELEALRAEMQSRIDELAQSHDASVANIETTLAESAQDQDRKLDIYGFFDLSLYKYLTSEGSMMNNFAPEHLTFVLSRLNVYFSRRLTDSLSAMAELEFRFMPNGIEVNYLPEYERIDTSVNDPLSNETLRLGGMRIQRVHMAWQPLEFLGILAGYFLTPYGIWNVDHGSPVITTIRNPFMQDWQLIPQHQLGAQILGTVHPGSRFHVSYALTISNGRGPADEVIDFDDNKGLGLRLRASYEGEDLEAALGGYGYFGKYTDISKRVVDDSPFTLESRDTQSYTEYLGALDVFLSWKGLRLQGEYVRTLTEYMVRPLRGYARGTGGYQPDYVGKSCYAQLSYVLPLKNLIGDRTLTPYVQAEYNNLDETVEGWESYIFLGGLNFKPSPFVTLKAEATKLMSVHASTLDAWIVAGQTAVSF